MRNTELTVSDRIVLALDVDDDQEAIGLVDELKDLVGMF
jgi:orotidine-5'-phosphate decarboxylase